MKAVDVTSFWIAAGEQRWFTKDAAFDGALSVRFGEALKQARAGAFDQWAGTPEGALGLILLLDQVSRNIHRNSPLAFAADAKALAIAKTGITRGFHFAMPAPLAMWFLMPLEHSEHIDDQERCVALFGTIGLNAMVHWAKVHRDIIRQFGRFPHRNKLLGRTSTAAETAFLASGGFAG